MKSIGFFILLSSFISCFQAEDESITRGIFMSECGEDASSGSLHAGIHLETMPQICRETSGIKLFFAYLQSLPCIAESEYGLIRAQLIGDLGIDDFLTIYDDVAFVQDWPEADQRMRHIIAQNNDNEVKKLVTLLSTEQFLRWYPLLAHHDEVRKRIAECYRKLVKGPIDNRCRDDRAILDNAQMIQKAIDEWPNLKLETPGRKSFIDKIKDLYSLAYWVPSA